MSTLVMEGMPMDENTRRGEESNGRGQNTSASGQTDERDDLTRHRDESRENHGEHGGGARPALTARERREQWPIG